MKKTIVIMAAGMGSRFGGLKQIEALGPSGEILMEYSVYDALKAGFDRVVFIIKESMQEEFHGKIGSRLSRWIDVDYAFQSLSDIPPGYTVPHGRHKPWGTSHAILCARTKVTTPFAVFNADDFYGRRAFYRMSEYMEELHEEGLQAAMVGYPIRNTLSEHGSVTRGICQIDQGFLTEVTEIQEISVNGSGQITCSHNNKNLTLEGSELCSMNFWGFTPTLFDFLEQDFPRFLREKGNDLKSEWLIPITIDEMIKQQVTRVRVLESGDSWFGITYPEDKPQVQEEINSLVNQGIYPSPLFPEK